MHDYLILIAVIIGLPVGTVVLIAATAMIEKRMLWPYGSPERTPQFPTASEEYRARWTSDVIGLDFKFLGWCPDIKGPQYKVTYGFFISPEHDCLAIIGVGAIMNMQLRGTWIYTRGQDGRAFFTTDSQPAADIDVSRRWRCQLAFVKDFAVLLEKHRASLRELDLIVSPFTPDRELEEFRKMREEHFRAMSDEGFVTFTDESRIHWRYSFSGALKWSVMNLGIGFLRAITFGGWPRVA